MQLAEFSPLDFRLTSLSSVLDISGQVSLGAVSGGPYISRGEFGDYSFHGLVDNGSSTGFINLPYDNPNLRVRIWILDLLEKNGLISDSSSSPTLEVFVERLKMEAQRVFSRNYRACEVELKLIVLDKQGQTVRETTVEGMAKLHGSDQTVVGRQFWSRVDVVFSPDEPSVCKLAIANALRGKQKGGGKTKQTSIRGS